MSDPAHKKEALLAQKKQPESTEEDVKRAIKVILSDKRAWITSLNYAVEYCRAGLHMSGHELQVQTLYILNNITGWRAPEAKEVRLILRAYKGGK
jgi:hypothetical protein